MRALAAALLLIVTFTQPAQAAPTLDTVTTSSIYGCLRTNGAGVYDATVNKTFVTYSGTKHDIYVKAFDHGTNTWSAAVKAATLNLTHDNAYHDYPVLTQLGDGRLAIFRATHTRSMQLYTAPTPRSITGTWTGRTISNDKNTYPEPIVTGNTIHLFYSHNTDLSHPYRTYKMIKSTDNGKTWSAPRMIIDSGRTADKYAEVYAFGVTQRSGRIYLTWSMHGGPKGHNGGGKNIYVAYFDTASGTLFTVAGRHARHDDRRRRTSTRRGSSRQTRRICPTGKDLPEENPVTVPLNDGSLVLGYGVHTRTTAKIVLAHYAERCVEEHDRRHLDVVVQGPRRHRHRRRLLLRQRGQEADHREVVAAGQRHRDAEARHHGAVHGRFGHDLLRELRGEPAERPRGQHHRLRDPQDHPHGQVAGVLDPRLILAGV